MVIYNFMEEYSAHQEGSALLTALLSEISVRNITIPKFIWQDLVTINCVQDMKVLAQEVDEATLAVLTAKLQWVTTKALEECDPAEEEIAFTAEGSISVGGSSKEAEVKAFDPKSPDVESLPIPLDEKIAFIKGVVIKHIVVAAVNVGMASRHTLYQFCRFFENLCELQLASLTTTSPMVSSLLQLTRIGIAVTSFLPQPEHFDALVVGIAAFQQKRACEENDLVTAFLMKGFYRDRMLAIMKDTAGMRNAIGGMLSHQAQSDRLKPFLEDSHGWVLHLSACFKVLPVTRASALLPGATQDFELHVLGILQKAKNELKSAIVMIDFVGRVFATQRDINGSQN